MNDNQERVESARVNEQLLAALKDCVRFLDTDCNACTVSLNSDRYPCHSCNRVELKATADKRKPRQFFIDAQAAIAAAEAQQADHIVDATKVVQSEPVAWDSIEAIATNRYKVVPSHESMFHRFAVVAGDGGQQLYLGREVECATMARRFAGAFLDGAFVYQKILATAQPPAQQQAEPVAAQCRFEGEEEWKPCTVAHHLLVQAHPKEWPNYETRALYAQPPAVDDLLAKMEEAEHHRDCLARAIRNAAVKARIIRADATVEGPQLLMLAYNLGEAAMLAAAQKGGA